jgi:cell division septal protein FtsQ
MTPKIVDLRNKKPAPREKEPHFFSLGEKRSSPLRARRRRARLVIIAICCVAAFLLAGLLHYVAYRPQFRIQNISVIGAREMKPETVEAFTREYFLADSWRFFPRDGIFTYPKGALAIALIQNYPRLASAAVERENAFSQELIISITERQPFGIWCAPLGQCYAMDEGGYIFVRASESQTVPTTPYIFRGGITATDPIGTRFIPDHMDAMVALLVKLGSAGFAASEVSMETQEDYVIALKRGFAIKASLDRTPEELIRDLQLVLISDALRSREAEIEYVDLRFGNRVYYKLKGGVAPTIEQ